MKINNKLKKKVPLLFLSTIKKYFLLRLLLSWCGVHRSCKDKTYLLIPCL